MMKDLLTVPNLLTLARLASLPIVTVLARRGQVVAAAAVFLAGMGTDVLDGWLAKKLKQQTRLGLYLDPVVDKIVILVLLYELSYTGLLQAVVPHLFLVRELLQNAVRAVAAGRGAVVGANWMGKTKAVLQTVLIAWGLLLPALVDRLPGAAGISCCRAFHAMVWGVLLMTWCFFGVFLCWNRAVFAHADPASSRPSPEKTP